MLQWDQLRAPVNASMEAARRGESPPHRKVSFNPSSPQCGVSLQWDRLRAPGGASMEAAWRGAELRSRRPCQHPVGGFEYLLFPRQQQQAQVRTRLCDRASTLHNAAEQAHGPAF